MLKYMKGYSDSNPERFNKDFIYSRDESQILEYVRDIFKSLEIIDEVKVNWVEMDTDESAYPPIIYNDRFYKPIDPSRLNRIRYSITFTPSKESKLTPILTDSWENITEQEEETTDKIDDSVTIEKELFINKLIDDTFYINEGVRYSLIYQIVDNSTYGLSNAVSLKSLLMPITVSRKPNVELFIVEPHTGVEKEPVNVNPYEVMLFANSINPIIYLMGKYSYNYLVEKGLTPANEDFMIKIGNESALPEGITEESDLVSSETSLFVKYLNEFFDVDITFADDVTVFDTEEHKAEGDKVPLRAVLRIPGGRGISDVFVSVPYEKLLNEDTNLMVVLGLFSHISARDKKKRISFSAKDLYKPEFWVKAAGGFFTPNKDIVVIFNKLRTSLISLDRLMDDPTRKILNIDWFHKRNTLTILRYIMLNFDELLQQDSQDLANKRLRLYEYQLYPLRKYFSDQIYRVLNSPTRSKNILTRIVSNLKPMYVIKRTITSELLRYYNQVNEMNLFTLLTFTFRGPQSVNRTVSMKQRDLHPSYIGNLSLVASNASDPGMSGTLTPFVSPVDYFFTPQTNTGYFSDDDENRYRDTWADYFAMKKEEE